MAPLTVMITSLFINLVNESFSKERRIHFTVPSFTQNKLPDPNANLHSLGREGPQTPIFPDFSLLIPLARPVISCTQTLQRHAFLRQDELSKLGYPLQPPQHHQPHQSCSPATLPPPPSGRPSTYSGQTPSTSCLPRVCFLPEQDLESRYGVSLFPKAPAAPRAMAMYNHRQPGGGPHQ